MNKNRQSIFYFGSGIKIWLFKLQKEHFGMKILKIMSVRKTFTAGPWCCKIFVYNK